MTGLDAARVMGRDRSCPPRTHERLKSCFQTGSPAILPNLDAAAKQSHTKPDDADKLSMILRQLTAQIKSGATHLQWIKASVSQPSG